MYTRWAESKGFTVTSVDYQDGDGAGCRTASLKIDGPHAYGYLKNERGVHRLVRISPFDAAGKRHTSFSAVDVTPEISKDIVIDIPDSDVEINTARSGGQRLAHWRRNWQHFRRHGRIARSIHRSDAQR